MGYINNLKIYSSYWEQKTLFYAKLVTQFLKVDSSSTTKISINWLLIKDVSVFKLQIL